MSKRIIVSSMDVGFYEDIRTNISKFLNNCSSKYDGMGKILLDIAPQDHEGAKAYFTKASVETLDINPKALATYTADLCNENRKIIPDNHFDVIVCTEVLEHTLNPFCASKEIFRILKPGGVALISTPYNFRIHGPLPDCWRFTEYGLRELFNDFKIVKLACLKTKDRDLMPIHYTLVARKDLNEKI